MSPQGKTRQRLLASLEAEYNHRGETTDTPSFFRDLYAVYQAANVATQSDIPISSRTDWDTLERQRAQKVLRSELVTRFKQSRVDKGESLPDVSDESEEIGKVVGSFSFAKTLNELFNESGVHT